MGSKSRSPKSKKIHPNVSGEESVFFCFSRLPDSFDFAEMPPHRTLQNKTKLAPLHVKANYPQSGRSKSGCFEFMCCQKADAAKREQEADEARRVNAENEEKQRLEKLQEKKASKLAGDQTAMKEMQRSGKSKKREAAKLARKAGKGLRGLGRSLSLHKGELEAQINNRRR
jgi:hypothetical protein